MTRKNHGAVAYFCLGWAKPEGRHSLWQRNCANWMHSFKTPRRRRGNSISFINFAAVQASAGQTPAQAIAVRDHKSRQEVSMRTLGCVSNTSLFSNHWYLKCCFFVLHVRFILAQFIDLIRRIS